LFVWGVCLPVAVERTRETSSPQQQQQQQQQQQFYQHHNSFRPIIDTYANSLSARPDIRSPPNCRQWSATVGYMDADHDDDEVEGVWTGDGIGNNRVRRHRVLPPHQPPAYSHSPPQSLYRHPTPISPAPPPIIRPDNYTLKRRKPAAVVATPGNSLSPYGAVDTELNGHLLGYLGETATTAGGDTTDSGYSLHRSTAPPSPAPIDNV